MQSALAARAQELQLELDAIQRCWASCTPTRDDATTELGHNDVGSPHASELCQHNVRKISAAEQRSHGSSILPAAQQGSSEETLNPNPEKLNDDKQRAKRSTRTERAAPKLSGRASLDSSCGNSPASSQRSNSDLIQGREREEGERQTIEADLGDSRPGQHGIVHGSVEALEKQLDVVRCLRELESSVAFQSRCAKLRL